MNDDYRSGARAFKKEVRWTFWNYFLMVFLMIVALSVIGFGLKSLGLWGSTVVERVVFENSFQYKTGMAQRGAILEANIAEIDAMLSMNPENRQQLLSQKRVLNVQLKAIKINE